MRLLITGGAGCLGSNLVERYFKQGHEICVIDNFSTGKREVVPQQKGLTVVEGSVANSDLVSTAFAKFKPTHVIHSAASYKNPLDWEEDIQTNVLGCVNVANAAKKNGVAKLINFQTALCYGNPKTLPIPINHPTAPFTSYGISKTAGEAYLLQSGLTVVSFRLANICGPRLAVGPIPTFYKRLKGGQSCYCSDTVRDFLDINDFFSLMDLALEDKSSHGTFNVSTGKGHSILDVFNQVAEHLGIEPPEVPIVPAGDDDVQEVVLDPTLTIKKFKWKPIIDFNQTIQRQLKWYDEYGVTDIHSHLVQQISLED